jgi:hypothetical protein
LEYRVTTRLASLTGTACRKIAFVRVKIVVFAPMPKVSDKIATAVNPGDFLSMRTANFMSCHMDASSR